MSGASTGSARIAIAPIQNGSGPSSVIGTPITFGISQSAAPRAPSAIVHATPKPAASS